MFLFKTFGPKMINTLTLIPAHTNDIYLYTPCVLFVGQLTNGADPYQDAQIAASDQGLPCLLTECSTKI